jgi:branched-chain amino acid transport system substrate-binding protein
VKVGMITNGGDCSGCAAGSEEAVAKATVPWLNEHLDGLAGHEIELDLCVDGLDPGKTTDCANKMIRDEVAAVIIDSNGVIETAWKVLHDAGIPVINNAATNRALLEDDTSTFVLNDPFAQITDFPIEVAKDKGADAVSVVIVDLPIATDSYDRATEQLFADNDIDLDVVPVPLGTPDVTPQAQQIVADNPDGVVIVVGPDQLCIPTLNGLRAVGFTGTTVLISQCLTDATRKAVPGDVLDGVLTASVAPVGDRSDESMEQYRAVLDTYGKDDVDPDDAVGIAVFQSLGALSVGTRGLQGEVTPASVIGALRSMDNAELPGSGGRLFRCNGRASRSGAAVCSRSMSAGTLDEDGTPAGYTVENNEPIDG